MARQELYPKPGVGAEELEEEYPMTPTAAYAALADDVRAFRQYLKAERGMADNTVLAYGRALAPFTACAADGGLRDYLVPTLRELSRYVPPLHDEKLAPPSCARHLVALKMFYRF